MSIASTNSPSTFLSTPSMPMSAIWCCAQLDEQPAKCSRKSSPWPLGRTCSSRNLEISTARLLVKTLARPQYSLPVQVCSPRWKSVGVGVSSAISGSASSASTFSSGIHGSSDVLLVREAQRVVRVVAVRRGRGGRARTAARPSGGRPGRSARPCGGRRRPARARRRGPRRSGPGAFGTPWRSSRPTRLTISSRSASAPIRSTRNFRRALPRAFRFSSESRKIAGDRGDDLGRLLGRDEDVDPAREARLRGEPAADAQVEALACRPGGSPPRARCR